jgi:UDP-N-acetylglucosamine diphosphorylase / glucose-1-phosphate thymidylyltransferase / UDP-N-acetylgalactosamine diphosphorylase / glucosamine-1-phosphate N-acetyltransferase / galactosamine-1-phosphate N-acetyltransferase
LTAMHVVIFEGSSWDAFAPFSLSRPTFLMACGAGTLLDKQLLHLSPSRVSFWVRPELAELVTRVVLPSLPPHLAATASVNRPLDDEWALLCNGRCLHLAGYEHGQGEHVVVEENDFIRQAQLRDPGLGPDDLLTRSERWLKLLNLPNTMPQARFAAWPWDLTNWNEEAIVSDSQAWRARGLGKGAIDGLDAAHVIDADNLLGEQGVNVGPGAVLDASKGPILLDRNASIGANAVVQGPCYIGPFSQIMPLAIIRPGVSAGPLCKLGGEVSATIIIGYTNKAHEGFLGDSYLGQWINLGAGTTTSNLKNTYGQISVPLAGTVRPTGRRFLGALIGDHTKTAIGTRIMSGSYVGFCCMFASSALPPRYLPSFTFWTDAGPEPYRLNKAVEVAKAVYDRRDRQFQDYEHALMRYAHQTAPRIEKSA